MKSLFFVSSPLEMICAIEARKQFKIEDSILVLYLYDTDKPIIEYILSISDKWNHIYRPYRNTINYGKKWVTLIKKLKKDNYKFLFTSSQPFSAHFLFNINFQKQLFLDDGTLTLRIVSYFKENGNISNLISLFPGENRTKLKHRLNEVLHYIFGHKLSGKWEELSVFTFFDISKTDKLKISKNKLQWFEELKIKSKLTQTTNTVFIIGTPLVKENIVNKLYYFQLLKNITLFFPEKELIYIPHRWENAADIEEISKAFHLRIRPNDYIIELDFIKKGVLPKNIVGTISTALFTLKKLYPEANIFTTSLNIDEVSKHRKESVQAILNYQKNIFQKITL